MATKYTSQYLSGIKPGSGAGTVNNLTLEALANMPAEEFAAATKDPAVFRRLMGG